ATVRLWNLQTGENTILATVPTEYHGSTLPMMITDVKFSPNGEVLAGSHYDGDIYLWDVRQRSQLTVLKSDAYITQITFNTTGTMLASVSSDSAINLWGVPQGS